MKILFLLLAFALPAFAQESESSAPFWQRLWGYLERFFTYIENLVKWLIDVFLQVFESLFTLLQDLIYWTLETFLTLASSLLNSAILKLGITSLIDKIASYWDLIPPDVIQVMQSIGVSSALAIVATGIIIRLVLQLIPFVRLGS